MKQITNLYKTGFMVLLMLTAIIMGICVFSKRANSFTEKDSVSISVKSAGIIQIDSVQINLWSHFTTGANRLAVVKSASLQNGTNTKLTFPLLNPEGIFMITTFRGNRQDNSVYFPVIAGDQVEIVIDSGKYSFSGKGAMKMRVAYELGDLHDKFRKQFYDAQNPKSVTPFTMGSWEAITHEYFDKPLDSLLGEKLAYLRRYKKNLFTKDYQWLKANLITHDYFSRFSKFVRYKDYGLGVDSTKREIFGEMYLKNLKHLYPQNISDTILLKTPWSGIFLLLRRTLSVTLDPSTPKESRDIIEYTKTLPQQLRENFIVSYLLMKGVNKLDDALIERAMRFVQSHDYLNLLSDLRSNVKIGEPAFDFTLENPHGGTVRLHHFKGKVVFMDFWFTGCKWCKVYYKQTLKHVEAHFHGSKDIVFLSICIDANKKSWMSSISEGVYNGLGSINLYTQGQGEDHQLIRHYGVSAYPTQIIIDKKMRNYNVNNEIQKKSTQELIQYLEELINKRI